MSSPTDAAAAALLAFRFPRAIEGCDCKICTRWGDSIDTNYPSPFILYRLLKWDAHFQIEREPTDAERAEFNATYPSMAFSRTADASGGKLETPWVKLCLKLVRRLKKDKQAMYFCEPVNAEALGLKDYHDIVKHPMSLNQVEDKLMATEAKAESAELGAQAAKEATDAVYYNTSAVYPSPEDFASDVRMVWRNAFLYNKPELAIHQMAKEMSVKFEQWYMQL